MQQIHRTHLTPGKLPCPVQSSCPKRGIGISHTNGWLLYVFGHHLFWTLWWVDCSVVFPKIAGRTRVRLAQHWNSGCQLRTHVQLKVWKYVFFSRISLENTNNFLWASTSPTKRGCSDWAYIPCSADDFEKSSLPPLGAFWIFIGTCLSFHPIDSS